MKIGLLGHAFYPHIGGMETQMYYLAKGLSMRGQEVIAIAVDKWDSKLPEKHALPVEGGKDIIVHRFRIPPKYEEGRSGKEMVWMPPTDFYIECVDKWAEIFSDCDVLNAHNPVPTYTCGLIKEKIGKPIVATQHDIPADKSDPFFEKACKVDAESFTTISQFMAKRGPVHGLDDIEVIYNGVDTSLFHYYESASLYQKTICPDMNLITSSSRMDPVKDIPTLVQAFSIAVKDVPNSILMVTGNGSICDAFGTTSALYKQLLEQIERLGIKDKVILGEKLPKGAGGFTNLEMPWIYSMSTLCATTSLHEGFGLAMAEAMACERAVIATNIGGLPEVVEDGVTGYMVDTKAPEQMAEKMIDLLKNPDKREEMGKNGAKRVNDMFSINVMVDHYLNVFNKVCTGQCVG